MKIIGIAGDSYDPEYIATVRHSEIAKFLNLYYGSKLGHLKVGDTVDLGKGHDHASQIADAMRKTQEFVQANQTVVTAILNGLNFQHLMKDAAPKSEVQS